MEKAMRFLAWAILPGKCPKFCRSRWTRYDEAVDWVGLLSMPPADTKAAAKPSAKPALPLADAQKRWQRAALEDCGIVQPETSRPKPNQPVIAIQMILTLGMLLGMPMLVIANPIGKRSMKGKHFFAPIWMAQSVVHNFRRMSMADLKPREPGYILYKEGWHEWDGRGKQEEEAFAGHTLGCIRLMVTDNNIEPFHWQDWEPIEHFAAQGVIKDSIWTARMTRLGLKARIDIPVAGTMINVVNDRLQVENPPNGWPITAESGWQEYHNKADQTFEEIVADLANTRFNKTVFEGTATAQAFEWDIAMETYWPAHYGRFRENGNAGAQTQGVGRSRRQITWPEWCEMYRTLPHSQPIGLVQSAYVTSLLRGDSTKLVQHQHIVLYERQNAAASLGMHMYGFRVVLKDTFAPGDLDTVINQLVFRGHGDLEQFVDDRDLFVRVVGEIMAEFNMQQPPEADTIGDGENKWIRIFWGREHVGPEDRDQWRDHNF